MTDNEIIKAMYYCRDFDSCNIHCPFFNKGLKDCESIISKYALDIIKRQKAEINKLKEEIEEANEADRESEVQALKESKENAKLFCEAINHAKSEAIKEFADRICEGRVSNDPVVIAVKVELECMKEMTEGKK